jgi:hypothetical protein
MEVTAIIAIISGAIQIVEAATPTIEALIKSGQISIEDQAKLKAKLDALRQAAAFSGPEWQRD